MVKCIICERRPASENGCCANCTNKLNSQRKRKANDEPQKFLTYRGHVVGLYPNGNGTLKARLLKRSSDYLPKSKTLDLNTYLPGFTRDKIKDFKCCVLQLANA